MPNPSVLVRPARGTFVHTDGWANGIAATRAAWATVAPAQVFGQAVGMNTVGWGGWVGGSHDAGVALPSAGLALVSRAGEGAQGHVHPGVDRGLVAAAAGVNLHSSMGEVAGHTPGQALTGAVVPGPPKIAVREVPAGHAGALPPPCAGERGGLEATCQPFVIFACCSVYREKKRWTRRKLLAFRWRSTPRTR